MRKFLKYLTVFIFALFIAFVLWMNVTPGFFRFPRCGCNISYFTDKDIDEMCQASPENIAISCMAGPIGNLMLKSSKVDFYK